MLRALPNVWAFVRYVRKFIKLKQRDPQDDLVSELVKAEVDGERLSDDELMGMVFLLLVAGHETTVNLIGNGVLALLEHPEQMELLRNGPGSHQAGGRRVVAFRQPGRNGHRTLRA